MDSAHRIILHESEMCVDINNFISDLKKLRNDLIKKSLSDEFIISQVYGNSSNDKVCYSRAQFLLAYKWFFEILHPQFTNGNISKDKFIEFLNIFIFDLNIYVNTLLDKSDSRYPFIRGGKSIIDNTTAMFVNSRCLLYKGEASIRTSTLISPFTLRQALEVRVKRMIGLDYVLDKNNNFIRFRHDFIWDFLKNQNDIIQIDIEIPLSRIYTIYAWTNLSIHTGIIPNIWEVAYAYEYCMPIFQSGKDDTRWNINGVAKIKDLNLLQERFKKALKNEYKKAEHFVFNKNPEAMILKK